jgi:predicted TIM-barrel fold metal-dependent hydrolase
VDTHFHVVAPTTAFPMAAERSYTPPPASLAQWQATWAPLGVTHGVVVQPSIYGTDNRVLLHALAQAPDRLVGIAAVSANVTDAELDHLAASGARGVRMAHFEAGDPRARGGFVPFSAFNALEDRLQARGLHLNLFTDSRLLPAVADRLARASVPVVIDHMGRTPVQVGLAHAGFQALCELLHSGNVWVKLSGLANVSTDTAAFADVQPLHEALLATRPDRLLWGSDWPHTNPHAAAPTAGVLMDCFARWTPAWVQQAIRWDNPKRLYGLPDRERVWP